MRANLCEVRRYLKTVSDNSPFFDKIVSGSKLTPTQRRVLILYIVERLSIRNISFKLFLSDSSIYRLLESSYEKIYNYLVENNIDGFEDCGR